MNKWSRTHRLLNRAPLLVLNLILGFGTSTVGILGMKELVVLSSNESSRTQGVIDDCHFSQTSSPDYVVTFDGGSRTFNKDDLAEVGLPNAGKDLIGKTVPVVFAKGRPDSALLSLEQKSLWALLSQEWSQSLLPLVVGVAIFWWGVWGVFKNSWKGGPRWKPLKFSGNSNFGP